ncbi:hypothetical protein [Nocardia jiangsuensis]|uniref:Lipoprotein n=1 Tax=Nocardia jiangsuensis TaxID=1691563 RepID=A0ABV8DXV2_9NOCA
MRHGLPILVGVALLAGVTGCTDPPPEPTPVPTPVRDAMTHGELCDAVAGFFADELRAVAVQADPNVSADLEVGPGTICEIRQDGGRIGYYSARSAPDEPDPTDRVRGFVREPALGDAVWVYDLRAAPEDPSTKVRFATRVEEWNATLEVVDTETRTADGGLRLSDGDKVAAVRFLRELTAELTG